MNGDAGRRIVIVDALNLARYGLPPRKTDTGKRLPPWARYSHLMSAIETLRTEHFPQCEYTIELVADSNFVRAMHPDDRRRAQEACDSGLVELCCSDRQADNWILQRADENDAIVVSADQFRNFAPAYPWILHWSRVWGPEYSRSHDRWGFGPRNLRADRSSAGLLDPREERRIAELRTISSPDHATLSAVPRDLRRRWSTDAHCHTHSLRISVAKATFAVMEHDLISGYGILDGQIVQTWSRKPSHFLNTQYGISPCGNFIFSIEESSSGVDLVSREIHTGSIRWSISLLDQPIEDYTSHLWTVKTSPKGLVALQPVGVHEVYSLSPNSGEIEKVFHLGSASTWEVSDDVLVLSERGVLSIDDRPIWSPPPELQHTDGVFLLTGTLDSKVLVTYQQQSGSIPSTWWVIDLEYMRETRINHATNVALGSRGFYICSTDGILSHHADDAAATETWRFHETGGLVLGESGNTVLTVDGQNNLLAVDRRGGEKLWSYGDSLSLPQFSLTDDLVACFDEESLDVLDPQDGSFIADIVLDQPIDRVEILSHDWILAELRDSSLAGLQLIPA